MNISIHNSNAALATMEALTAQSSAGSSTAAAATANPLLESGTSTATPSALISLSGASAGLSGLSASLSTSASITDAAVAAGSSIQGVLSQMRQDALQAAEPGVSQSTLSTLNASFKSGLQQIQTTLASAKVSGVNLIDGSSSSQTSSLTGANLSLGGPVIGVSAGSSLTDTATSASLAAQLGSAIEGVGSAVSRISDQGDAIQSNLALVAQAGLSSSASGSVSDSLDSDGARLTALQIQQQLSSSGTSIGNQTPQAILALFR